MPPLRRIPRYARRASLASLGLVPLAAVLATAQVRAEIVPTGGARSLGTASSCGGGSCAVTGGVSAGGRNLYHRFDKFHTSGQSVEFRNGGHSSVVVGVIGPLGTRIDAPVSLQNAASLLWLSPAGIAVTGQGGFRNVTNLTLTTQTGLRMGQTQTWFDVFNTTAAQLAANPDYGAEIGLGRDSLKTDTGTLTEMGLAGSGPIQISPEQGVELAVDRSLLIDSGLGDVSMSGASLRAGTAGSERGTTSVALYGNTVTVGASSIEAAADGILNLQASQGLSLSDSTLKALKIGLRGGDITVGGSTLTAPRGTIQATADTALRVNASTFDVAPRTTADVEGPGLGFVVDDGSGGPIVASSVPAVISLETTGSGDGISINNSTLDATSLVAGIDGALNSPQDLIAGNIVVSSATALAVKDSQFIADADRNYAGQISLYVLGSSLPLELAGSTLTANSPNGSGDLSLFGEGGVSVATSRLEANSTGADFSPVTNPDRLYNPAGEIRITSRSPEGITIQDSLLSSRYSLNDHQETTYSSYLDTLDSTDNIPLLDPLGGRVRLTASGTISLQASTVDTGSDSGVGGTIEILSSGGEGIQLTNSSLLARVAGPLPDAIENFFFVPPDPLEGLRGSRVDLVSTNGINIRTSEVNTANDTGGPTLRFDLGIFDFVPLTSTINLITAGTNGSGLAVENSIVAASSPTGITFSPYSSQGSSVLLANENGPISRSGTSFNVSGDLEGTLSLRENSPGERDQYLSSGTDTLTNLLERELGSDTQAAFSLSQLAALKAQLTSSDSDIIIDNRDPTNVIVTVINQSLTTIDQSTTRSSQTFNITTVAGRKALERLLNDIGQDSEFVRESVFTSFNADFNTATTGATIENPQSVESGIALTSLSPSTFSADTEKASSTDSNPTEAGDAEKPDPLGAATARLVSLASPQATASLVAGEERSARELAAFLGAGTSVPTAPSLSGLQKSLQQQAAAEQGSRSGTPAILRLSYAETPQASRGKNTEKSGESEGTVDLVLVLPEGSPQGWSTEIQIGELRDLLRTYYADLAGQTMALSAGPPTGTSPERRLFDLIIRPALPTLEKENVGSLILSADTALIDIPFNALHDGRQYLSQRFALAVTPSLAFTNLAASADLQANRRTARMNAGASIFSNGLTPLPMVEQELRVLSEKSPGAVNTLVNQQFTPTSFTAGFSKPGLQEVHIASHAEIASGKEKVPKIYTGNEVIGLRELALLRKQLGSGNLDLVTLSACRSALSAADLELGFAGLAVQLGARTAIGTKWYVDDLAISSFFVHFYDQLARGLTKAEAVQATQRAFIEGQVRVEGNRVLGPGNIVLLANLPESYQHRYAQGFSHPYYWAGVQLVGSPW